MVETRRCRDARRYRGSRKPRPHRTGALGGHRRERRLPHRRPAARHYTLTFSLTGFNTQIRDGLELAANFVATINVDLAVGTLQESVTVSGVTGGGRKTNAKQV